MNTKTLWAAILIAAFVLSACNGTPETVSVEDQVAMTLNAMNAPKSTPTPGSATQVAMTVAAANTAMQNGQSDEATAKPPTSVPTRTPAATNTPVQSSGATGDCSPTVGNLDNMPKTVIELAPTGQWFHRVFNTRLFNQANNWGGADSWFVTLALGNNSGGSWTSHGNPGQVVYRGTSTHLTWCLGILTTAHWKSQFMGNSSMPAAINVRIAPDSVVTVTTASGKTVQQTTSDMGDITIILPDSGVVTISVDYTTAAPTHESLVWWGPYDRSANINTIDAR